MKDDERKVYRFCWIAMDWDKVIHLFFGRHPRLNNFGDWQEVDFDGIQIGGTELIYNSIKEKECKKCRVKIVHNRLSNFMPRAGVPNIYKTKFITITDIYDEG